MTLGTDTSVGGHEDNTSLEAKEQWSVEKVLSTIPGGAPANTASPIPFFHMLERLKTTKREGWRRFGIENGESISDHMYRMSLITMLAPPSLASRINVPHCTKMALLHDVAEALVGDITPADGIPKVEKSRRETTTMEYFTKGLLGKVYNGINGKDLMAVWQEYEDGKTLESKFVHDVDKMELILQMLEYEKSHEYEKRPGKLDLGEFSGVIKQVQLPEVRDWCVEILKEREEHWKNIRKEHTQAG